MAFATFEDVNARYFEGEIPESKRAWVDTKLGDVENRLLALCPWLSSPTLPEAIRKNATAVIAEALLRIYRNPGRKRSQSTPSGFSYTNFDAADGGLTFTEDELESLRLPEVGSFSGFGSVDTVPWMH